jgi:translation initiation factor 1 (eIF-1/SUI1)
MLTKAEEKRMRRKFQRILREQRVRIRRENKKFGKVV